MRKEYLTLFIKDGTFRGCPWRGDQKPFPLPKICHTYSAMIKLGKVISYLKKNRKIYESYDTHYEFCFYTENQQIFAISSNTIIDFILVYNF